MGQETARDWGPPGPSYSHMKKANRGKRNQSPEYDRRQRFTRGDKQGHKGYRGNNSGRPPRNNRSITDAGHGGGNRHVEWGAETSGRAWWVADGGKVQVYKVPLQERTRVAGER